MTIYVNKNLPNDVAVKIALSKFKKACEPIIKELRSREAYIKPSVKKRMKSEAARKLKAKWDKKKNDKRDNER